MAGVLKNVTNSIWHAFDALRQGSSECVHKSKLKVLTANIGSLIDLYGIERGLDQHRSTGDLDFEHFKYYLQLEVFPQISNHLNMTELRNFEEKIDEVCWLICRKNYLRRDNPLFPDSSVYQVFRIFCLLGDLIFTEEHLSNFEVIVESSEAGLVAEKIINSLGLSWDSADWESLCNAKESFNFKTFLLVLETKCYNGGTVEEAPIVEAIDEIYQIFTKDIIKKGFLLKKGYLLPTLREYWFVLRPHELTYYKSQSEKLVCGSITLTTNSLVVPGSGSKPHKLLLVTPERTFELATQDHKCRLQWISALQLAIEHSSGNRGYQRSQKIKRCKEKSRRKEERSREIKKTNEMLQEEMRARVAAETQVNELFAMAREESKELVKLKDAQIELERLLAEETQAKQDEEIVRTLQARVLTEEWEKREELERLQEEQRHMLNTETLKRKRFEKLQKVKETELKEAESRLRQLEIERQKLDDELKLARNRIKHSEDSQQILEEQLLVMCPDSKPNDKIRRSVSFMPSSTSTERTLPILQARAATLRRNSKKENNSLVADKNTTDL